MKPYAYHGITHPVPGWLLNLWRLIFCRRNCHAFDETSSDTMNYLHCDACGLMVHIESVDNTYQQL